VKAELPNGVRIDGTPQELADFLGILQQKALPAPPPPEVDVVMPAEADPPPAPVRKPRRRARSPPRPAKRVAEPRKMPRAIDAALAKRIIKLYTGGATARQIVESLKGDGVTIRPPWVYATVRQAGLPVRSKGYRHPNSEEAPPARPKRAAPKEPPNDVAAPSEVPAGVELVRHALNLHFQGHSILEIASETHAPASVIETYVAGAYRRMDRKQMGSGPDPQAAMLWQSEMGPEDRLNLAKRVCAGK
jgi:hypothetical protein